MANKMLAHRSTDRGQTRACDPIGDSVLPYPSPETTPASSPLSYSVGQDVKMNDPFATDAIEVLLLDSGSSTFRPFLPEIPPTPKAIIPEASIRMSRGASNPIEIPSRGQSRARGVLLLDVADTGIATGCFEPAPSKNKKRRKKKIAQQENPNNVPDTRSSLAPTPVMSGDESEFSTYHFSKKNLSLNTSLANSPFIRPLSRTSSLTNGISALRQQVEEVRLARTSSNTGSLRSPAESRPKSSGISSVTSGYQSPAEEERLPMDSYELALNEDFISDAIEETRSSDPLSPLFNQFHRRMSAQDFDVLTCLGKGSFGTVHLVKQKATGKLFAQKMFRKASLTVRKTLIEQTKTERAILENINRHPFIVNLYYAFQDQEKLYLILEYAQGGELFTHLAAEHMFPEETAAFYTAEMIVALNYLHETGIVYRDLKPENCLLDADGHLLLTDFGLSKEVAAEEADRCKSILGTWEYMAPEVIEGKFYDKEVDWWSLGAVAFDLLTGNPPFTGNNNAKIQEKILKAKIKFPYFLTPDAKDLLTRLLRRDPRKRLGSNMPKDLQALKTHRFFRKLDWKKLENRELEPPIRPVVTDPALAENFSPEFTQLALSPRVEFSGVNPWDDGEDPSNPFGGFSYVASKSLFRNEGFLSMAMQLEEEQADAMMLD